MDLDLRGKIAVVTGASAGIGRAIAELFGEQGVKTLLVARRADLLAELADKIEASGGPRPVTVAAALTKYEQVGKVKEALAASYGRLDILVNVIGGTRPLDINVTEDQFVETLNFNFGPARWLTHMLLPIFVEQKSGRIINFAGTNEAREMNGAAIAKAATQAWSKGLSLELGKYGVTINCIIPGRVDTPQLNRVIPDLEERAAFAKEFIPLGRDGKPREIANFVAFLASDYSSYMTGEVLRIDGGKDRFAF